MQVSIDKRLTIDPSNHKITTRISSISYFQDSSLKNPPNIEDKILQHYPSPTKTSTFLKELLPHPRQVLGIHHTHIYTHTYARSVFVNPTQHFDPDLPTATSSLPKKRKGDRILLIAGSVVSKRAIKLHSLLANRTYYFLPFLPPC